jgi:hypothetical protein
MTGWDGETGIRVRIVEVVSPLRQPHQEHIGKLGTITGTDRIGSADGGPWITPVITLDDGTVLYGFDCWWEPIKEEKEG